MQMLFRIIVLVTIIVLGWLLGLFIVNVLIKIGMTKAELAGSELTGQDLETISKYIIFAWLVGIGSGIISLFMHNKWRYVLLLGPLLVPTLSSFIIILNQ